MDTPTPRFTHLKIGKPISRLISPSQDPPWNAPTAKSTYLKIDKPISQSTMDATTSRFTPTSGSTQTQAPFSAVPQRCPAAAGGGVRG